MSARTSVRRGQNIRSEKSIMKKVTLKVMRGRLRYNTITRYFREENVEGILSYPNIKPSCVSSNDVTVLNQKLNIMDFSPKLSMEMYL